MRAVAAISLAMLLAAAGCSTTPPPGRGAPDRDARDDRPARAWAMGGLISPRPIAAPDAPPPASPQVTAQAAAQTGAGRLPPAPGTRRRATGGLPPAPGYGAPARAGQPTPISPDTPLAASAPTAGRLPPAPGGGVAAQQPAEGERRETRRRPSRFGAGPQSGRFEALPYPTWTDGDSGYRLFPGDRLELVVRTEEAFNRTLTVAPDGRVFPPVGAPIMAADKTVDELESMIESQLALELINPESTLNPVEFVSQQIFVGGEVTTPGVYELNGEIDALQAITRAGGFRISAQQRQVVILRRGPGGRPMMRVVDLWLAARDPAAFAALPRLRRFDVVFVPRSKVSEVGLFTQQFIREALPISLGFSYTIDPNN